MLQVFTYVKSITYVEHPQHIHRDIVYGSVTEDASNGHHRNAVRQRHH